MALNIRSHADYLLYFCEGEWHPYMMEYVMKCKDFNATGVDNYWATFNIISRYEPTTEVNVKGQTRMARVLYERNVVVVTPDGTAPQGRYLAWVTNDPVYTEPYFNTPLGFTDTNSMARWYFSRINSQFHNGYSWRSVQALKYIHCPIYLDQMTYTGYDYYALETRNFNGRWFCDLWFRKQIGLPANWSKYVLRFINTGLYLHRSADNEALTMVNTPNANSFWNLEGRSFQRIWVRNVGNGKYLGYDVNRNIPIWSATHPGTDERFEFGMYHAGSVPEFGDTFAQFILRPYLFPVPGAVCANFATGLCTCYNGTGAYTTDMIMECTYYYAS